MKRTLGISALALLASAWLPASATLMSVPTGCVGSSDPLCEVGGLSVTGEQRVEGGELFFDFWFVFENNQHLEPPATFDINWMFSAVTPLADDQANPSNGSLFVADAYLTDMDDRLPLSPVVNIDDSTVITSWTLDPALPPPFVHDFHLTLQCQDADPSTANCLVAGAFPLIDAPELNGFQFASTAGPACDPAEPGGSGCDPFVVGVWDDVPEPASLALLGLGLAGLSWSRRRA